MTYEIVFWMMAATWLVSVLYPWHPSWPKANYLVHLPWALIPMGMLYEWLMPAEMNIRIDLLLIGWALGFVFTIYLIRLTAFSLARKRERGRSSRSVTA